MVTPGQMLTSANSTMEWRRGVSCCQTIHHVTKPRLSMASCSTARKGDFYAENCEICHALLHFEALILSSHLGLEPYVAKALKGNFVNITPFLLFL